MSYPPQSGWPQPQNVPPQPQAKRSWYKKKRFIIPIGIFVSLAIYGSFIDDPVAAPAAQPLASVAESTTSEAPTSTLASTAEADAQATAAAEAQAAAALKERRAKVAKAKKIKAAKAAKLRRARAVAAAKKKREEEAAKTATATVTPGAFCADSEAGDIGVSSAGNSYRCSLYSSGRYRWKRL